MYQTDQKESYLLVSQFPGLGQNISVSFKELGGAYEKIKNRKRTVQTALKEVKTGNSYTAYIEPVSIVSSWKLIPPDTYPLIKAALNIQS